MVESECTSLGKINNYKDGFVNLSFAATRLVMEERASARSACDILRCPAGEYIYCVHTFSVNTYSAEREKTCELLQDHVDELNNLKNNVLLPNLLNDSDKGFTQEVIACYKALTSSSRCVIPRRFEEALLGLGKDDSIINTQADKGGVIILNKTDHLDKILDFLGENSTYERQPKGSADNEAESFKIEARILRKSEKSKKLLDLLVEAPRPPNMYGLPKVHKVGIPMRPITSGIGSAPHRLAKILAKPLSNTLGSICGAHPKNSTDLIKRLKTINFTEKILVSYDATALFTIVSMEGVLEAVKRVVANINDDTLPVPKTDYIKLISMCVEFKSFTFNNNEYKQLRGLAMRGPVSAMIANLYIEISEANIYMNIMVRGSTWLRYVDHAIVILLIYANVENRLRRLKGVSKDIQFTIEIERKGNINSQNRRRSKICSI
ncbi:uncharacterized protein LOC143033534 [Oratosquilla oratoria]|uniref:uncharacterized protein LOC143033534 n=1 Tax=Oratosquilla oratoria TaxID=337810 RepID=UPI003F767B20